jgi:hypothetical protein
MPSAIGRVGAGLIIAAIVLFGLWSLWADTRTWCPVNVPISLSAGNRFETAEFIVNLNAEYAIEIEARNKLPINTVSCMLGVGPDWPNKTCSTPSVLKLSWLLLGNGRVVEQGSSDQTQGGGGWTNSTVARTLGHFRSQQGMRYALQINVLADGSTLSATEPRLRVTATGQSLELELLIGGMLKLACTGFAAVGAMLLLVSIVMRKRTRKVVPVATS